VAVRYPRGTGPGTDLPEAPEVLEAGKAQLRRRGSDVAVLAVGRTVATADAAAELLAEQGVEATVVNLRWVKPLDLAMIAWAAAEHPLVVTVEENTGAGGAGAAVLEALSDMGYVVPLLRLSIPDCFVTHGDTDRLLAEVGLTPEGIRDAVVGRLTDLGDREGTSHDTSPRRHNPD
jgi:1-deoxy-D-xylulose-5-phosphate synthase